MLSEQEILDRINHSKNSMEGFKARAFLWESMWKLDLWQESKYDAHSRGQEQVTLPDPLNIVHLAERLIDTNPEITCPPDQTLDGDAEEMEKARKTRMRFLTAFWTQNSRQQRKNIISHAWWMSLVRSRLVWQVKHVEKVIPGPMKKTILPYHVSVLDPLKCGFHHGPLFTEWAYYEDDWDVTKVHQYFPDLDLTRDRKTADRYPGQREDEELETSTRQVTEFWYMDEGKVYSSVLVDDELAQEPKHEPNYFRIPLIEVLGDDFPITNESERSHSILRPIEGLWEAQCRLVSQIATGQLWHFFPQVILEGDEPVDTTEFGPGHEPIQVPMGTKVSMLSPTPNLPISDRLLTIYETEQQQSSFPPTLYGATTGGTQSGYEAQIHQSAARGRVKKFMANFEMGMEAVNQMLLCFVDKSKKSVTISGNKAYQDVDGSEFYSVSISNADVNGNYANAVDVEPDVPQEDTAINTLALRYGDSSVASKGTVRDISTWDFPEDEDDRIRREREKEAVDEAMNRAQAMVIEQTAAFQVQMEQQQQQMAQQQAMMPQQPQMGMPNGTPPGAPPPGGVVPQSPAMMGGMASQQQEGQITPEMMGNLDPQVFQSLINGGSNAEVMNAGDGRDNEVRR